MILAKLSINNAFATTVKVFLKSLQIKNCKYFSDRSTMTFALLHITFRFGLLYEFRKVKGYVTSNTQCIMYGQWDRKRSNI
jgi:hypothetical protein